MIGTLWAVSDYDMSHIALMFYKYMVDEPGCLNHTHTVFAMNKTMKSLSREIPLDEQILYIHLDA